MLTLIKNVEIFAPERLGRKDVLIAASKILTVGDVIRKDAFLSKSEQHCYYYF
jgi:hypothetical protein